MDVARDDEVERELSLCGSIGQFAFKITTPADLEQAASLIARRSLA